MTNGEPINATADSCFSLFGPRQCVCVHVAPGIDQQLLVVCSLAVYTFLNWALLPLQGGSGH